MLEMSVPQIILGKMLLTKGCTQLKGAEHFKKASGLDFMKHILIDISAGKPSKTWKARSKFFNKTAVNPTWFFYPKKMTEIIINFITQNEGNFKNYTYEKLNVMWFDFKDKELKEHTLNIM